MNKRDWNQRHVRVYVCVCVCLRKRGRTSRYIHLLVAQMHPDFNLTCTTNVQRKLGHKFNGKITVKHKIYAWDGGGLQ